jgi:hypothetical protein
MLGEPLRFLIALFGAWTLFAQALIFLRYDFATLVSWSLLPVLAGALLLFVGGRKAPASVHAGQADGAFESGLLRRLPPLFWFLCPFLIVGSYFLTQSDWIFWGLASAFLLAASVAFRTVPARILGSELEFSRWEWPVLAAIGTIAVAATLGTLRADPDDAFFVSLASSALDHPTAPLYGFDNLYRDGLPLMEQARHLMQTYEYFVAMLASLSGISVHTVYYLVLPGIWTVLGVLVQWLLLRRLLPPFAALVGLAALVAFLVFWGDEHRTFGNFGFVRMYQGKAIYLFVVLPMIVWSALAYRDQPNWRNWALLLLHQCAGVGFSLTALFVAPLAAGAVLLASAQWSRRSMRITAIGLAASMAVLCAAVGMKVYMDQYAEGAKLPPELLKSLPAILDKGVQSGVNAFYQIPPAAVLGYRTVLGMERSSIALLVLLLIPFLASRAKLRGASWLCNYLFVCTVLFLCPAASQVLEKYVVDVLNWRIFWAWPVPLLLALAIGALACPGQPRPWTRWAAVTGIVLWFAVSGSWAVSRDIWALKNMGHYKVYPGHAAAEYLMSRIDLTKPALLPEEMAISMVGFRNAPPLTALRNYYLRHLPGYLPKSDLVARRGLLSYIDGRLQYITTEWVVGEIKRRDIATVAFSQDHRYADVFSAALRDQGFVIEHRFGYVLAIRGKVATETVDSPQGPPAG